ncbi:porin family protein [Dokdonia sp. Hel_I_53]|uniref:porin family protein n=1 Tax=Dokdonia sp. Hel_I_53 TaxID=1566287 RepID=UPI00119A2034|nr:porin family protein [Dokdonia sp. Hel_I_53]TVZ50912.1 outer membrane protein with beta-barrel domain [Dokdonia sp. Hel_I_53]
MKKIFLSVAFVAATFITVNAQETTFGLKGGVNFASINGDDLDDLDGRTSFHVGAVANFGLTEAFAIQPEVVYSSQGASEEFEGDDINYRLNYINIPVLADYTFAEGFSAQFGPQFGINVSSDVEFDGDTEDLEDVETLDLGLAGGLQYSLDQGIFFQARYTLGLNNIFDFEDADAKNGVFALSVGYNF